MVGGREGNRNSHVRFKVVVLFGFLVFNGSKKKRCTSRSAIRSSSIKAKFFLVTRDRPGMLETSIRLSSCRMPGTLDRIPSLFRISYP